MRIKDCCSFNLGLFSQYRSELMGIATLLIIICHAPIYGVQMPQWLSIFLSNGGLGVDIFLFLSGMGMYNSWTSNKKKGNSLLFWLFKRYIRIIIPSILIIIPIYFLGVNQTHKSVIELLIELSGLGALFGKSPLWFISCILLLYIITPLFSIILYGKRKMLWLILLTLTFFTIAYMPPHNNIWHFIINRWPSYLLGFALAPNIKEQKLGSSWNFIFIPLFFYILLYTSNHVFSTHFSLFWLQGISVMTVCVIVINKYKYLNVFLSFMGIISLESYITNEYVLRIFSRYSWQINDYNLNPGNWTFYIVGSIICIAISYVVNKYSKIITQIIY